MDILNDYEVEFFIMWGKQIKTKHMWLSAYIGDYKDFEDVQSFLEQHIYAVMNGEKERGGEVSESSCFADINILETKIYKEARDWKSDNALAPDLILPTLHFKTIFEAWRDHCYLYG